MLIKTIKVFIIAITALNFLSCKDKIVNPNDDENIEPGRRDYTWTIDSLETIAPYNSYYYIWGSSPNDVWIVGNIGDLDKTILRYDGNSIMPMKGAPVTDFWSITGFEKNNVWLGDESGNIYNYNGSSFKKYGSYILPEFSYATTYNFYANSPNDIYAVGSSYKTSDNKLYGHIMHFDGKEWKYVIKPGNDNHQYFKMKRGTKFNPNYYMIAITGSSPDSTFLYEFNGQSLKFIYKDRQGIFTSPSFFSIEDRIYIYINKKFYRPNGSNLEFYKDFSDTHINGTKFFGRSEKDFFVQTTNGIGHYNGTDLTTILPLQGRFGIFDAVVFEKDVFFVTVESDSYTFYLIHGKLKE